MLKQGEIPMKRSRIYLIIAGVITVFIFSNSLQTASRSSEISGGVQTLLMNMLSWTGLPLTHRFVRKAAHFTEFFMQSLFMTLAAKNSRRGLKNGAVYVAFGGLLTACCDEFLQLFSAGRSSQVSDVFIDFFGTVAAIAAVSLIQWRRKYAGTR